MYTTAEIIKRRQSIHCIQFYKLQTALYCVGCIHDNDDNPEEWTISLMRLPERTVEMRRLSFFLELIDSQALKLTDVRPV